NAGHPKPLHVRRDQGAVLPLANGSGKSQPALGLFRDYTYQTSTTNLDHHDLVMLFTDGLYEVHNAKDELYTQALLTSDVQRPPPLPAQRIFDSLLDGIRQFSGEAGFSDDVCLVGIEFA